MSIVTRPEYISNLQNDQDYIFKIHEIITPPRALLKGNNREVRDKRYTLDFEKLLSKVSSQNSSIMIWLPTNFVGAL